MAGRPTWSSTDLRKNEWQGAKAVNRKRLAAGFPASEGGGEDEVVVGGAASSAEEFRAEGFGGAAFDGDGEHALFE